MPHSQHLAFDVIPPLEIVLIPESLDRTKALEVSDANET